MISTVDKLLLSADQQAQLEQYTNAYNAAKAAGDQEGMKKAHQGAEAVRATAGYSGGVAGDRYELAKTSSAPSGYNAYEKLANEYANRSMNAIASAYDEKVTQLAQQEALIHAQGEKNQAAARSSAWNAQRLAADGLLTRGLDQTGIADVITATALNQAAANAYIALLEEQEDLNENALARASARTDALDQVASLQNELGERLGNAYLSLYESDADRNQELLLKQMGFDFERDQQASEQAHELDMQQKEQLAERLLKEMGFSFELTKQQNEQNHDLSMQQNEQNHDLTMQQNEQAAELILKQLGFDFDLTKQKNEQSHELTMQEKDQALQLLLKKMGINFELTKQKNEQAHDLSMAESELLANYILKQLGYQNDVSLQTMKNQANENLQKNDFNNTLTLQQLKRKWELEDQKNKK